MTSPSFRVLLLIMLGSACRGPAQPIPPIPPTPPAQPAQPTPPAQPPPRLVDRRFFTAPDMFEAAPRSKPGRIARQPPRRAGVRSIQAAVAELAVDEAGPSMRVHLIDVGQGAATLIELSCAAVLIDTGGESNGSFDSNQALASYLEEFFRSRSDLDNTLALLLLTHPHIDHARGAKSVWANHTVQNVVTNGVTRGSGGAQQGALIRSARQAGIGIAAIRAGAIKPGGLTDKTIDPVRCDDGDPDIRVLWGAVDRSSVKWTDEVFENANNHSVAVKVSLGEASIIVTGDLEEAGIEGILALHKDSGALDASVYQVGHHGSHNATTEEFLELITPELALIAVGSVEREMPWTAHAYGHPREHTIGILATHLSGKPRPAIERMLGTGGKRFTKRRITAPIFATGWDGHVRLTMFADGRIGVRTERTSPATGRRST